MGSGLLFWLLLILCAIFGFPGNTWLGPTWSPRGAWLFWIVMFGILGWHSFGAPLHMQ